MTLLTLAHRKISVWCSDCNSFIEPVYKKEETLIHYDGYNCPKCGRLLLITEKSVK